MELTLSSPAFEDGGDIPLAHTCDGKNISPPLSWEGIPTLAKSFALIIDDPDAPDPEAPKRTWVHWVLYNIPVSAARLAQGIHPQELPKGTLEGLNDWQRTGYGGPCPPIGRHRYVHKLYALDTLLPDLRKPTKAQLESAMQDHILGHAQLIGLYERGRPAR